ncbi:MAG: hypothetical protein PHI27_06810 [Eubacteriales bacterium]|nr:hypothetical protein [Eubacteriales bacterium]MDD3881945.1 hypothetical protein [Eubacteriales bacterium]MDD4513814.1 hypothetical protein [Eubacteriales bacterium]
MKRLFCCLLILLLSVTLCSCGSKKSAPEATESPLEAYQLLKVPMSAPAEAEKADYSAQGGTIAQITFVYDGFSFVYRGGKTVDFTSGVYEKALSTKYVEALSDNESETIRLSITVTESGNFLIEWTAGDYGFSLYSPDKILEEQILSMAESLALKTWRLEKAETR